VPSSIKAASKKIMGEERGIELLRKKLLLARVIVEKLAPKAMAVKASCGEYRSIALYSPSFMKAVIEMQRVIVKLKMVG